MLRALVYFLILLNGAYFFWSSGLLAVYGWAPVSQREPQRLAMQLQPEAVRVVSEVDVKKLASVATPRVCLESNELDASQADVVRTAVQAVLPASAWVMDELPRAARWTLYMGPYPNAADLEKKRVELGKLSVRFEMARGAPLAPGLTLGNFDTQAKADAAIKKLVERGVRSARVVEDGPTKPMYRLRLPALDDSLQARLSEVRAALPGQTLQTCVSAAPG